MLLTIRFNFRIRVIVEERFVDAVGDISIPEGSIRCDDSLIVHVHKILANAIGIGSLHKCLLFRS